MRKLKLFFSLVLGLVALVVVGCGGGGGDTPAPVNPAGSFDDPTIDIVTLAATTTNLDVGTELITVASAVALPQTTSVASIDANTFTVAKDIAVAQNDVEMPLFSGNDFLGIVTAVTDKGDGTTSYTTRDAVDISEVYDEIDLSFAMVSIQKSLQRALQNRSIGTYDHLNKEPLRYSVRPGTSRNASGEVDDLILRVEIPEGYIVPVDPDLSRATTSQTEYDKKFDLSTTYSPASGEAATITFSTSGSFIEFSIKTDLNLYYHYLGTNEAAFIDLKLSNDAILTTSLAFQLDAEITSSSGDIPLHIMKPIEAEIIHPNSAVAKVFLEITPDINIGLGGKLSGTYTYETSSSRSGNIIIYYNTKNGGNYREINVSATAPDSAESSSSAILTAEGTLYAYPSVEIRPAVKFLRVTEPVKVGSIRSGIKFETTLSGTIGDKFQVVNDAQNTSSSAAASLVVGYYPLVEYKPYLEIAGKVVGTNEFVEAFKGTQNDIFNWSIDLLSAPTITIETRENKQVAVFDITDANAANVVFLYTIGGSDPILNGSLYDPANPPIVTIGQQVKVVAKMDNPNPSTWQFGTSYSETVVLINNTATFTLAIDMDTSTIYYDTSKFYNFVTTPPQTDFSYEYWITSSDGLLNENEIRNLSGSSDGSITAIVSPWLTASPTSNVSVTIQAQLLVEGLPMGDKQTVSYEVKPDLSYIMCTSPQQVIGGVSSRDVACISYSGGYSDLTNTLVADAACTDLGYQKSLYNFMDQQGCVDYCNQLDPSDSYKCQTLNIVP